MQLNLRIVVILGLMLAGCAARPGQTGEISATEARLVKITPVVSSLAAGQATQGPLPTRPVQPNLPNDPTAQKAGSAPGSLDGTDTNGYVTAPTTTLPACAGQADPAAAVELVNLINGARTQAGLKELRVDSRLEGTASQHNQDMACHHFVDHVGSDGRSLFDRITAAGYAYVWAGENIYAGALSAQAVFDGWMNSPGHRANILKPEFEDIGVSVLLSPTADYGNYYTADFGTGK